jgi:hypothetical protein
VTRWSILTDALLDWFNVVDADKASWSGLLKLCNRNDFARNRGIPSIFD